MAVKYAVPLLRWGAQVAGTRKFGDMVSFRIFVLILSCLFCKEVVGATPRLPFVGSFLIVAATVFGFALLAKLAALRELRRGFADGKTPSIYVYRNRIELLWMLACPVIMSLSGWLSWGNQFVDGGWSELLTMTMIFAPTAVFFVLLEATASQVDIWQPQTRERSQQEAREAVPRFGEQWRLRLRLGEFASLLGCLTPVFVITAASDLFALVFPGAATELIVLLSAAVGFSVMVVLYPLWIGRWFGVRPLDGSLLQDRIEFFVKRLGMWRLDTVVVPSEGRWCGAAVVGWLPFCRRLWIGDGLVSGLTRPQLDMVILHELAHVKQKHFFWRTLPVAWACGIGIVYYLAAPSLPEDAISRWTGQCIVMILTGAVLVLGLGVVGRGCELDADRAACNFAEQHCDWAAQRPGKAAATLAAALTILLAGDVHTTRQSWQHPSLKDRLVSLARGVACARGQA